MFFKKFIKGFTLVEIIVVLALMVIGASIALPNLSKTMSRAEKKKYETYLINAKTMAKGYVDLLNLGEYKYPVTKSDGVTVKTYDISNSANLNVVLNYMNTDNSYGYYVMDSYKTVDGKNVGGYNPPSGEDPSSNASVYKDDAYGGKKNTIAVSIKKNSNGIYSLQYLFYVHYSSSSPYVVMTYKISNDTIVSGYKR